MCIRDSFCPLDSFNMDPPLSHWWQDQPIFSGYHYYVWFLIQIPCFSAVLPSPGISCLERPINLLQNIIFICHKFPLLTIVLKIIFLVKWNYKSGCYASVDSRLVFPVQLLFLDTRNYNWTHIFKLLQIYIAALPCFHLSSTFCALSLFLAGIIKLYTSVSTVIFIPVCNRRAVCLLRLHFFQSNVE